MSKKKILVSYFSCSGVTERVAKTIADALGADMYKIEPADQYTAADLNWDNPQSRSSVEMNDASARPKIASPDPRVREYEIIFIGFPIWWYVAPRIINTFLESHDFSHKIIVPFATSGGSGLGRTEEGLRLSSSSSTWLSGKLLSAEVSKKDILKWVENLNIR